VMLSRSAFAPRHKNRARPPEKSAPAFLQWLRGRPCLLDGKHFGCGGKIEAAHVDYAGDKGMSTKVSDRFAVPMCSVHHGQQHQHGWRFFEATHGDKGKPLDALAAAKAYWRAWPGRRAWEAKNG
jgi:hypothetical protein